MSLYQFKGNPYAASVRLLGFQKRDNLEKTQTVRLLDC